MKLLDLFSGIGGFHLGLEQAGFEFDWVGFSEIDKYASQQYKKRFPEVEELGDITTIRPDRLPEDITILCGGFPCQSFSIAGKRGGFKDTRGTLFFEIARILRYFRDSGKPIPYFILENVKGLLNHDSGRTFSTIYSVLADLDYTIECELLNTRNFSCPQNRERIYIVGYIGDGSGPEIFPIGEYDETHIRSQARAKSKAELCSSITTREGGRKENNFVIVDKTFNPKLNQKVADYRTDEGIRIRESGDEPCLTASHHLGMDLIKTRDVSKAVEAAQELSNKTGKPVQVDLMHLKYGEIRPLSTYIPQDLDTHRCLQTGEPKEILVMPQEKKINKVGNTQAVEMIGGLQKNAAKMQDCSPSLTSAMGEGGGHIPILNQSSIRRLTPKECERLQGFPDGWTEGQSDTQRYKQLGNAVSVPVVKAVGDKIFKCL